MDVRKELHRTYYDEETASFKKEFRVTTVEYEVEDMQPQEVESYKQTLRHFLEQKSQEELKVQESQARLEDLEAEYGHLVQLFSHELSDEE